MERNPYAPPNAPVVGDAAEAPGERPVTVTRAVWLLWGAFALNFVAALVQPLGAVRPLSVPSFLIFAVLFAGLWIWFIGRIAKGGNWARVLLLILTILGCFVLPLTWRVQLMMMKMSVAYAILYIAVYAASLSALCLLFTRSANAWFRSGPQPVR